MDATGAAVCEGRLSASAADAKGRLVCVDVQRAWQNVDIRGSSTQRSLTEHVRLSFVGMLWVSVWKVMLLSSCLVTLKAAQCSPGLSQILQSTYICSVAAKRL